MRRLLRFIQHHFIWALLIVVTVTSQAQTNNTYYVCVVDINSNMNLFAVKATEPVGFMFSHMVDAFVYSDASNPLIADVIHIDSDTQSGTYRRTGDVLRGAYTTSHDSIPDQTTCDDRYSELQNLDRTILMPLSTNQAMAVYSTMAEPIEYDSAESTLMIGSVGFLLRSEITSTFPHFQILRFSGGRDDRVSINMPQLVEESNLYIIANQRISQNFTDPDGFEDESRFLNPLPQFAARLNRQGENLLDTIMGPGKFRFYVQYGSEITYEPDSWINIDRLSNFVSREIEVGNTVYALDCNIAVSYMSVSGFSHYWYLDNATRSTQSAGQMRNNEFEIVTLQDDDGNDLPIRDDGVLMINTSGGILAVPAWLVNVGSASDCPDS